MKKNKYSYLKDYFTWLIDEKMPDNGLCHCYQEDQHDELMNLIHPTANDKSHLYLENKCNLFWGSDSHKENRYVFTPLRQNLVLLMAALNNEL